MIPAGPAWPEPDARPAAKIYVPYRDLAAVVDPAAKSVLMDRAEFAKLLALAADNARAAASIDLGQVPRAEYTADVTGEKLAVTGELTVVSMSDKPVAVPMHFAQLALTDVTLDAKPAPLGYDKKARLVLIVTGRGAHKVKLSASTTLKELSGGGMQFGVSLPSATAGRMILRAPGDLEIHATVPASAPRYDKQADRTSVELTLGGHAALTVVLAGNGRQEDQSAILLGESATSVRLSSAHQVLDCLYTVQVLRQGVRELVFELPKAWTVTDVSCPSLVRWSVTTEGAVKALRVRLRKAARGTQALHIQATSARAGGAVWRSPRVALR
ncbi:hypothetical protein LCGC14_1683590, partial [marine sediment metagenome]